MKRHLMLIFIVVVAITATVAAYYKNRGDAATPAYTTAAVTRGDVVQTVDATGTLEAVTTVQVSTQVSGTVKALYADFNTRVRKGQVVAELEPSLFQTQVDQAAATVARLKAEVDRAKVQLEDANVKLARARELSAQQLIARSDLDTAVTTQRQAEASVTSAEAQVTQAVASLNQSQVTLGHTIIRAPIDGIVISRNVDVGQTVAASTSAPTLFVIAQDLTQMRVNASVDESDIGRIRAGQTVAFRVDAYPDEPFTGTVSQVRLEPITEQNVVSYVTVIDVPNPDLELKPGMTANVTIEVARADDVLKVPAASLRFRPSTGGGGQRGAGSGSDPHPAPGRVWVLEGEAPTAIRVQTGISDGTMVAITGGDLTEGAQVITGGAAAASTAAATTAGTSPLIPRMGRGARQGGQAAARGTR